MIPRLFQLFMMSVLILLPLGLYAQDRKPAVCDEFQRHLNRREGLTAYVVEEKEIDEKNFNFMVPGVDIDGDKVDDKVLLFRTGSASFIPPDSDSVTLVLSSTGEEFTMEAQRFFIILYKSQYYIVATEWLGKKGPVFVDIKSMGRNGIKPVCAYKCTPKTGSCVPRRHYKEK